MSKQLPPITEDQAQQAIDMANGYNIVLMNADLQREDGSFWIDQKTYEDLQGRIDALRNWVEFYGYKVITDEGRLSLI